MKVIIYGYLSCASGYIAQYIFYKFTLWSDVNLILSSSVS